MIYLDNAATTFPKPASVISAVTECISSYCGNPARSTHRLAERSLEKIFEAREAVARLLSVDNPEGVVFTYNATYALNLAIKSFITEPCTVLISDLEHNAVVRPLERLHGSIGIKVTRFSTEGLSEKYLSSLIDNDTKAIVSTLSSNVTGKRCPIEILSRVAKKHGIYLILDGSQALGHYPVSLRQYPADVVCAPSHKALFGIQGAGFAYFKESERRLPLVEGGSGGDSRSPEMPTLLPEGYEAGTPATPSIVSLLEGIKFIESIGVEEIEKSVTDTSKLFLDRLRSIKGITLHPSYGGTVSFNYKDIPSYAVAKELDRRDICTRAGLHCAPSAHGLLDTLKFGTVRISLSYFNTKSDADGLYRAMKEITASY